MSHFLGYLLYSIPFAAIMKAIFCKIFDFFKEKNGTKHGQKYQTEQKGHHIRRPVAQFEQERACQTEIEPAAHQQTCRPIHADAAAPGMDGPDKQRHRHAQPEQQIQRTGKQP